MSWLPRHSILSLRGGGKASPEKENAELRKSSRAGAEHPTPKAFASRRPTSNSDSAAEDSGHYSSILPGERPSKSLQSCCLWEFNGGMKIKILICAVVAGCLFGCAPSTVTIKGTVCSCTDSQITVLEQDGKHYDIIQRKSTTIIKPPMTPPCTAGTPVEVTYNSGDAQRKESPTGTCPTSTSPSG